MRACKLCKSPYRGRSDKVFCSVKCKTCYHHKLNQVTRDEAYRIDKILHRNRSILLEIMGKHKTQKKIAAALLDKKKFNYTYITKYLVNSKGKTYHYVYDFAWMRFSNDEILIVRRK